MRAAVSEEFHALERLRSARVLPRVLVQEREVIRAPIGRDAPEHHQSILRAHRQRLEDETLGDGEHGRREPNAERQRQYDACYPPGRAPECADGEPEILSQIEHQSSCRSKIHTAAMTPATIAPKAVVTGQPNDNGCPVSALPIAGIRPAKL